MAVAKFHRNFIIIIIIGSVFADLLYGILDIYLSIDLPIGIIFRTLIIVVSLNYIIKSKVGGYYRAYVYLICFLWIVCITYWILANCYVDIYMELSFFIKMIYPFVITYYLKYALDEGYVSFSQLINFASINGTIAGIAIVFSFVTGIGFNTYGYGDMGASYGFGSSSFFEAQNDLSLAMLLAFSSALFVLFTKKGIVNLIKCTIIFLGLSLIGTRAGLIGSVSLIFIFILYEIFYGGKNQKTNIIRKMSTIAFLIVTTTIVCYGIINAIISNPYMLNKYAANELESPRAVLHQAASRYIDSREDNTLPFLFGKGNFAYTKAIPAGITPVSKKRIDNDPNVKEKIAEEDFVDLRGGYGLILALAVFAFPIFVFIKLGVKFIKDKRSYMKFAFCLMIVLFLAHSILAGHAIRSPPTSAIIPIVYAYSLI